LAHSQQVILCGNNILLLEANNNNGIESFL
jgi:hypothetical protein